ncbi:unnamed protein product [Haemonchus placei]|uniref:DUF148 domain-containing protein n=1 Tax=Haemonchus placei TaxID=6290 RepID=A0A0N4WEY3_HAEPC|nr:unnamed protein product [Haemonchus placei]
MKTALLLLAITSTAAYGSPPGSGQNWGSLPETFLNKVDKPSQLKYFAILSNTTMTIAEQKKEIQKWAEQNGVLDEVKHYDALEKKYRKKLMKLMTNIIEELPSLLENLMTVMEDQNQTSAQMLTKLQALGTASPQSYMCTLAVNTHAKFDEAKTEHYCLLSFSDMVYNVLNFALRQFMIQPYPTGDRPAPQPQPHRNPAPEPQPQRRPAPQPQPQPQRSHAPQPQPQRSHPHGQVRRDQYAPRDSGRMKERHGYEYVGGFWKSRLSLYVVVMSEQY